MKARRIQEQLAAFDKNLASAEAYLMNGVNVRGSSWLHLEDWKGRSGHPKWMKNHMIPSTRKAAVRLEKKLERIAAKERDRRLRTRASSRDSAR